MSRSLIANGDIALNSRASRAVVVAVAVALAGLLLYHSWWLFLAAWITREFAPDPAVYERAIRYDPSNADYQFLLGQIYNSSTEHLNLERAGAAFKEAVRLNPLKSAHWQELAKWYEAEQQLDPARDAARRAIETDPNYAKTHWFAANLYLRIGDMKEADFEMRRAADLDTEGYLTQVLDLVWRFYEDPVRIVSTHVPNSKGANLTALNYFISKKSEQGATLAWTRLKTFETTMVERKFYVEYLVKLGQARRAAEVFSFPNPPVLVFNGGFERESLQMGFDWSIASPDNAEARRDSSNPKEGLWSLRVSFAGKENIDYNGLAHLLAVEKGRKYNLTFWMKTEDISTNEGVFVEVDGRSSEKQVGSTYWKQFALPFTASSDLVTVRLRRLPTNKFDNLLRGKVWLDDFQLTAVP